MFEKATGRGVAELLDGGIVAPLGLNDTRSEDNAVIQEPALHAYADERGLFEDATYWSPSWTLARGAIMTTNISTSSGRRWPIGTGAVLSEASVAMLAPRTVGLRPLTPDLYYGLGVVVNNGWILQNPSFFGYSAVMAYQPANGVAIAVAATKGAATPDRPNERLFYRARRLPRAGRAAAGALTGHPPRGSSARAGSTATQDRRCSSQISLSGRSASGSSRLATVTSMLSPPSSKLTEVPQVGQKPRAMPGEEAKRVIGPVSEKADFGTVAQATASAPAARRQSRQWQIDTHVGAVAMR